MSESKEIVNVPKEKIRNLYLVHGGIGSIEGKDMKDITNCDKEESSIVVYERTYEKKTCQPMLTLVIVIYLFDARLLIARG